LDFGNLSLLIGQVKSGGVDVILNDSSNRQTATYVSIQGKQRFLGDDAATMARSNLTNTVSSMKLLVGRLFDEPEVQKELSKCNFKASKLQSGLVGIHLLYNDEEVVVSAEQTLAMMLVKAKDIAAGANNGLNLADAVLAVPNYYTDSQRRGILNACEIAGVNCLKVANESMTVALSYGIFKSAKKLFSESEPTRIMFIDLGYTCYTVSIVDFITGNMKVLSTVCDPFLGGRDFDDVIIEFLAEAFETKYKINVRGNKKAILKLQAGAEKAKKTLSPHGVGEASVSVECLAEEKDLSVILTKEEFEKRCEKLVGRLSGPIEQALVEAGVTKKQLHEVEIVGGTSRVNIVKRRLSEILDLDMNAVNNGLKTTMNADEAVARGGALQCAMLSSRMKVAPFNILEKLYYGINLSYDAAASSSSSSSSSSTDPTEESKDDVAIKGTSLALYSRGDEYPHKPRRMTFPKKTSSFSISASYDTSSSSSSSPYVNPGNNKHIAKFTIVITPEQVVDSPKDVRVTFNVDKHGVLFVQSAQLLEEYTVDEPLTPTPAPAEGSSGLGTSEDEKKKNDDDDEKKKNEPPVTVTKKKLRKIDLTVTVDTLTMSRDDVKAAIEVEATMALEDKLIKETAGKRNELESYIYSMRDKIDASLKAYSTPEEASKLKGMLVAAEDWLYGDGFDEVKSAYTKRIDELRSVGNPIESRQMEESNRPQAISALKTQIDLCKAFAANYDDAHSHIEEEERNRIRSEASEAESWLFDMQAKQGDMPANKDPVLTSDEISKRRTKLFNVANPIMIKPKPKPVPKEEPKKDEAKDKDDKKGGNTNTNTDDDGGGKGQNEEKNNGNNGGDDSVPMDEV